MTPEGFTPLPRISIPEWRTIILIALLLTAASIAVHWFSPSSMHLDLKTWDKIEQFHYTYEPFRVRLITTNLLSALSDATGILFKTAFFSFQFSLFFVSCLSFYAFLRHLIFTHRESLWGAIIFHAAVPLFLANFEPIHTWDDFWVYIFVPLSSLSIIRRNYVITFVAITISMLSREVTLGLIPIWFWLLREFSNRSLRVPLVLTGCAIGLFIAIRLAMVGMSSGSPEFCLQFNFKDMARSRDSIFSILIANGFVWLTGLWQAWKTRTQADLPERFLSWGALYVTSLFFATGLLLGHARESRLFTVPAIFLVPLTLHFVREYKPEILHVIAFFPGIWRKIIAATILLSACFGLTKLAFPRFEYRPWQDGNWGFFALHLSVCLVTLVVLLLRKHKTNRTLSN